MSSFSIIAIIAGVLILGGLYFWLKQAENADDSLTSLPPMDGHKSKQSDATAVIVATQYGQVVHVNATARQWLGLDDVSPDLEYIAGFAEPSDNFLQLFESSEVSTSFQFNGRWMQGQSYLVPADSGYQITVAIREVSANGDQSNIVDLAKAMSIVAQMGETINTSMGIEQTLQILLEIVSGKIAISAGEICLWNEKQRLLEQRGWVGDPQYLLAMAEIGGAYQVGEGVAGWIAEHRKPVLLTLREDTGGFREQFKRIPYRSIVAVPLILNEDFIGTLGLFHNEHNQFSQIELALLQAIAKSIALAIYNANLYTQQVQRLNDISSLQEVAEQSKNIDDIGEIYALLNQRIAQMTGANMSGVFLHDEVRNTLYPQLPFYGLPDSVAKAITIPLTPNSTQREIWESQPYWISNDAVDEPLIADLGLQAIIEVAGIQNTGLFPLEIGGDRIGMIAVSNKLTEGGFTPRDIQNLRVLVAQASIVVENIRLYQREQRIDTEQIGLQEMTHVIGSLSHEGEFYAEITERIGSLMGVTSCGILLYEPERKALVRQIPFYGVADADIADYMIDITPNSVMEQLWEEETHWISNRVLSDPLVFEADLYDIAEKLTIEKTMLAILKVGGRRIGIVQVSNRLDGADFTDNDAQILEVFATQAATIIENARLYRQVQASAEQARSLQRLAELAGFVLTPDGTFANVLQEVAQITHSPQVFVNILDNATSNIITQPDLTYGFNFTETIVQDASGEGHEEFIVVSKRDLLSNNVRDDQYIPRVLRTFYQRLKINQIVSVPLSIGERNLGSIAIANRENTSYTDSDIDMLHAIAAHISAAIERLLLYESTGENLRTRMEELDAISRVSNELTLTIDFDQILDVIRHEAQVATHATGSTVALLLPPEQWQDANQPQLERRIGSLQDIQMLTAIEQEAIRRGVDPVRIDDYQRQENFQATPVNVRSAMATVIMYVDQIVGVLHLYHTEANQFDDRVSTFLMTLATKASLGYQNSLRYHEQIDRNQNLRNRVEQLNRIFDLGQMVQTTTDVQTLLEAVAYSIQQSVGFDYVLMLLADTETQSYRRIAQAGLPLNMIESTQDQAVPFASVETLFAQNEYLISDSYFYPVEKKSDWYHESLQGLLIETDMRRNIQAQGRSAWHEGDLLVVRFRGTDGNNIGLVVVDQPQNEQRPAQSSVEVLEIFAHQASTMVENVRLVLESKHNVEQETRLNTLLGTISNTLELEDIISVVAQEIRHYVEFHQISVAIYNINQDGYNFFKIHVDEASQLTIYEEYRASLRRTALGRMMETGEFALYDADSPDVGNYEDLRSWYEHDEKISFILPLITGGERIGVLHIGSNKQNRAIFQRNQKMLQRLAQLLAGAVQNARLFSQAVSLQILNESVVESIQQGIVVLDNSGRIINANNFMQERYGWNRELAIQQDLFAFRPELREWLSEDIRFVLEYGMPRDAIEQATDDKGEVLHVRNFYMYPLRYGDTIRGAVILVDDITDRVNLERSIQSRANQLSALTDIAARISATLERDEVISLAVEEMNKIAPFDTISIWRRNGSSMVLEGFHGIENASEIGTRIAFKSIDRLRQMVDKRRILTENHENGIEPRELMGDEHAKSWMGVPLINQNNVTGMIILTSETANLYEIRAEQNIIATFASQIAIGMANAELFEQTFERTLELRTLLEAAQSTSLTRNLDQVYFTVSELLFDALEMDNCSIMLWNEIESELEVQSDLNRHGDQEGLLPLGTLFELSSYPAKRHVLEAKEVITIVDKSDVDKALYPNELESLHTSKYGGRMLVPLVVGDQSIGLIQLQQLSNDEKTLTGQKARLAQALGSQMAIAIENARLSTETYNRFEELMIINQLSQSISATLDLGELVKIVRENVPNLLIASEMYLALYDPETQEIAFPMAVRDNEDFEIPARPLTNDEVSYIIKNRRPLSLGADYFSIDEVRKSMGIVNGEGDSRIYMGVPLASGDQVFGALAIRDRQRSRAFSLNDERILTTVGSQISAAIQNAKLYAQVTNFATDLNRIVRERTDELEEERDRLNRLYEITSELTRTLEIDQLALRGLELVSQAIGADEGALLLSDPMDDSLRSRANLMKDAMYKDEETGLLIHPAEALGNWLLQNETSQEMLVHDLHKTEYWDTKHPASKRWRSGVAVLLEKNNDPMGVMVFLGKKKKAFTDTQVKLLAAAANQIASAINNAELYQLIREQAERLSDLVRSEREESERSNAILEGIADGVLLADADGIIMVLNSAAETILQLPRSEILGQSLFNLTGLYGGSTTKWFDAVQEWSQGGSYEESYNQVVSERLQWDNRVVSAHFSPVYTGNQFLGTVSVFRDITRDVEVDRIKTQFVTSVSHEFRTPLTPIKGYTDLLIMGAAGELNDAQQDMLGTMKENIERLNLLVEDVLNIARLDSGEEILHMDLVNLNEIIPDIMNQLKNRIRNVEKHITVKVNIHDNVPKIRADRDKLIQMITNLIDNAFNYTRSGGKITAQAEVTPDKPNILITITDTGIGIPEEFYDAIWRRFERYEKHALEMDIAGTGLGLPLVREIANRHNGNVWFESEVDKGTTFFLELPIEQPQYATGTTEFQQVEVGD